MKMAQQIEATVVYPSAMCPKCANILHLNPPAAAGATVVCPLCKTEMTITGPRTIKPPTSEWRGFAILALCVFLGMGLLQTCGTIADSRRASEPSIEDLRAEGLAEIAETERVNDPANPNPADRQICAQIYCNRWNDTRRHELNMPGRLTPIAASPGEVSLYLQLDGADSDRDWAGAMQIIAAEARKHLAIARGKLEVQVLDNTVSPARVVAENVWATQ